MQDTPLTVEKNKPNVPKESSLDQFLKEISQKSPQERLSACLSFMQTALSENTRPDFKGFWEVRKLCLPLFKEEVPQTIRTQLWETYVELTREGRRLKSLLDEESAFAVEQIDLAVKALEKDLEAFLEGEHSPDPATQVHLPQKLKALNKQREVLENLQSTLNVFNLFATRINSLRKELIKTEMRVRFKNKFFQRLSKLGDTVFPKRKELIQEVSQNFEQGVESFIQQNFSQPLSDEALRRSLFFLREEIKTLQSLAKVFTLNTHAFTTTREVLSKCWDQLRGKEKDLKREFAEQKQRSHESSQQFSEEVKQLAENELSTLSDSEALARLEELQQKIPYELTRQDKQALNEEIEALKAPYIEKQATLKRELQEQEREKERLRKEQVQAFRTEIEDVLATCASLEISQFLSLIEAKELIYQSLNTNKLEKHEIEALFKRLKESLCEMKEKALLSLSDADQESLEKLRDLLQEKQQTRRSLKLQLEIYRKELGGSSLDFEKAIDLNEKMSQEKEKLEKCDGVIRDLESKIRELKKKAENLGG